MWDIADILACPYCHLPLKYDMPLMECIQCARQYHQRNDMFFMYDGSMEHWKKCEVQIKALERLTPDWDNITPRHDPIGHPYSNISVETPLSVKANAGMFNVAKDLIGLEMFRGTGYALDVGATLGWASFQLAENKKTVALDICDHVHHGIGSIPQYGYGICKVVADGCYMPFRDESFDVIFACSAFHHMHDKVKFLDEAYRLLRVGGVMVTFGDKYMPDESIQGLMQDGIREYEGPAYTLSDMLDWYEQTNFKGIQNIPFQYNDYMHELGYYSLMREPKDNMLIYGVKGY